MAEIWYLVTSFIYVCDIVGSVFGPVRFLLSVCRLRWFLYTHWTHMRGYHKWALAHSSSCCIIHIGTIQFLYNICLFDFHFGLCYSRVVFTLEKELLALPGYLSASLVILWVSCCSILSFQCSAMSTIIFIFVSFFGGYFFWRLYYQFSSICDFWKYLIVVEWFKYGYSIMHPIQYYYFIQGIICLIEKWCYSCGSLNWRVLSPGSYATLLRSISKW